MADEPKFQILEGKGGDGQITGMYDKPDMPYPTLQYFGKVNVALYFKATWTPNQVHL